MQINKELKIINMICCNMYYKKIARDAEKVNQKYD